MEALKAVAGRVRKGLANAWRELLMRSSGRATRFQAQGEGNRESLQEFPHWSLLAAETWETAQSVIIRIELPGISQNDVATDIDGEVLRIRGEKFPGSSQPGRQYHLKERAYGKFERRIPLPHGVDPDSAEIACRDGVLTVILPKTDILPPRQAPPDL